MRTHLFGILAIAALTVACQDGPNPIEPAAERTPAFDADDLQALLDDWIRRAPTEAPRGRPNDARPRDPDIGGAFATVGGGWFNFDPTPDPNEFASAATPASTPYCGNAVDAGYYHWAVELLNGNIGSMDATLLAGGTVQAETATTHNHSGEGASGYRERVRLQHWSLATGIITTLATDGATENPVVQHTLDWQLPITSTAGWAPGDSLIVEEFGVAAAHDSDCESNMNGITTWNHSGSAPRVTY